MVKLKSLTPAIRLAVACLILALGLRTWVVLGLIEPVTVSGSSMVPALRGTFVTPHCPSCEYSFSVGAEYASTLERMKCPRCLVTDVQIEGLKLQRGDRLWIDRATLNWREPQRWEAVVARNPHDGTELCIKRVVGLPGEQVELRDGEVRIGDAVPTKTLDEQRRLRQLVHRETAKIQRWVPGANTHWRFSEQGWCRESDESADVDWITYRHPAGRAITDDMAYNAGLTRKLNQVDEFMLSVDLVVRGAGAMHLIIDDGASRAEIHLALPAGTVELFESGRSPSRSPLARETLQKLNAGIVSLDLTNIDQQLLLVLDDHIVLRRPWPSEVAGATDRPFSIGVEGLDVTLGDLSLYRDIYHSDHPVGAPPARVWRWHLGPGEYFLLGDNAPVSIDSRLWGPVPGRLIVGKPL